MQCPSVILYLADMPCPHPLPSSDLFNHVLSCLFSYPNVCFLSRYVMLKYSFPSLFVRLLACSLLGW